jgi:hypothetical protein
MLSPLGSLGPLGRILSWNGEGEPKIESPDWTDDREWLADIPRAPDEAAKLEKLAAWVTAAGGEICGRTVMLPALRPHPERRLAELELRRMVRQFGLEILEDEQP